ncbi:MAG: TonB-dependent receptor [Acidobacteria bacterium]|nr:TonB-dependent receptor [Acidobacteriota bacterium]
MAAVLFLTVISGSLTAQGGTGIISGTALDAQGGVLPGVSVTLRNQASGITRTAVTEGDGSYRFPALPPGRYAVLAELSGFSSVEVRDIEITIGLGLTQNFTMQVQTLSETITVTGEAPVVDTTKSEVSGVVTQQQIEMLPINSRQYLSLALLMPGTSMDSTRSFFATVNVGGSMTFNSTGNLVDGMINNFAEDGEPRQNMPEDAVEEFKVSNVQYKAEFGLATGGIVQVVTKSGTNTLSGSVFEYFRDKALNARGPFEPEKPAYRRNQFGGSVGGPLVRDKVHYFAAAERTKIDEFYTVQTAFPQFYSALEGIFERPFTRNLYFGRVDGQLTNTQSFFARYAHEDERSTCNGCGGTTASTNGYDQETPRRAVVLGHTWVRGARQLNDFRFQYARAAYYISPAGTEIWRDIGNTSAARLDRLTRQFTFPSVTYGSSNDQIGPESRWQVKNTYTINLRDHDVKFGADISHMPYKYESTGNPLGTYTFSRDQYFDPSDPASIAALTGAATFSASIPPVVTSHPNSYYVAFAQDDWTLRDNLTLNLGLRWERLYGAANEDLDPSIFPIPIPYIDVSRRGDTNNFGPRLGLAWDVFGTGRTVVRGGYGLYYGHVRILGNLSEFRNYQQFSVNITNPTYPDPYGGRDPQDFIVSGPANITVVANDYVQPYSNQFNGGFSHQLTGEYAFHLDLVATDTHHDRKILDINARVPGEAARPNPTFARVDRNQSTGSVRYRALYAKFEKRYSKRHQFLVTYTYMRARDNAPLGRYLDPFDLDLDWGPSNGERRHAIVASGSVRLPLDVTAGLVWTARSQLPWSATAGRDLNGDGFNTDLVPGTERNAGGRNLDLAVVNAYRASIGRAPIPDSQIESSRINLLDMRLSKALRISQTAKADLVAQLFNVFNTTNLQGQYGGGRVGNASSDAFGRILTARPGRQAELALRLSW